MKISEVLSTGLMQFLRWLTAKMETNWAKLVVKRIRNLPPEQLQNCLKTGEGRFMARGLIVEVTTMKDYILNKIKEVHQRGGIVNQREIVNQAREEFGRRAGVFAMINIDRLIDEGIVSREFVKGETLLKLCE